MQMTSPALEVVTGAIYGSLQTCQETGLMLMTEAMHILMYLQRIGFILETNCCIVPPSVFGKNQEVPQIYTRSLQMSIHFLYSQLNQLKSCPKSSLYTSSSNHQNPIFERKYVAGHPQPANSVKQAIPRISCRATARQRVSRPGTASWDRAEIRAVGGSRPPSR